MDQLRAVKFYFFLLLVAAAQFCSAQVPKDSIMEFAPKPLHGNRVSISIRGGEVENEKMVQVTIATAENSADVDAKDVLVSAMDETRKALNVLKSKTTTLVHPDQKGMKGGQWASFKVISKDGQKMSSVKVEWLGDQQTFTIAEGVLRKE